MSEVKYPPTILVCQNRTCKRQGSLQVLAAFQFLNLEDVNITASGCLGQCGNGPMVLILPQNIWYSGVKPKQVPTVIQQSLSPKKYLN
jgi:(2Fe-2S) ferredoxin